MKAVWDFIKGTLITLWAVVAIFSTICLLTANDYMVSEFGDYSLFVVDNTSLEPYFKKNDILIVQKGMETDYNVGDLAFFYYGNKDIASFINLGKITDVERVNRAEDNYMFNDLTISYGNVVGSANMTIVISKLGLLLNIIESRWGFMFLVILPTLYAIVYEIYTFVVIVKADTKEELEEASEKPVEV